LPKLHRHDRPPRKLRCSRRSIDPVSHFYPSLSIAEEAYRRQVDHSANLDQLMSKVDTLTDTVNSLVEAISSLIAVRTDNVAATPILLPPSMHLLQNASIPLFLVHLPSHLRTLMNVATIWTATAPLNLLHSITWNLSLIQSFRLHRSAMHRLDDCSRYAQLCLTVPTFCELPRSTRMLFGDARISLSKGIQGRHPPIQAWLSVISQLHSPLISICFTVMHPSMIPLI
jgi:hypothetical protein